MIDCHEFCLLNLLCIFRSKSPENFNLFKTLDLIFIFQPFSSLLNFFPVYLNLLSQLFGNLFRHSLHLLQFIFFNSLSSISLYHSNISVLFSSKIIPISLYYLFSFLKSTIIIGMGTSIIIQFRLRTWWNIIIHKRFHFYRKYIFLAIFLLIPKLFLS